MPVIDADANATVKPLPEVVEAVARAMAEGFGNPSSAHAEGRRAAAALTAALDEIAALIGALEDSVALTSGGTEANNAAIHHLAARHGRIVTSSVEHASVAAPLAAATADGCEVVEVPVGADGVLDLEIFEDALSPDCGVALQWANGETGVLQPIERVAELCVDAGAELFVDAAQAVGRVPVDLSSVPIGLLSFSGHKLHGPPGTGALFVRDVEGFEPFVLGGGQQSGLRSGTVNVPGAVGLAAACRFRRLNLEEHAGRMRALRNRFEAEVLAKISGVEVNGARAPRVPNTSNLRFSDLDGQALLARLDALGVLCSQGAACSSGRPEPSRTLKAMRLTETMAYQSLRFSFSFFNTEGEIEGMIGALIQEVAGARRFVVA